MASGFQEKSQALNRSLVLEIVLGYNRRILNHIYSQLLACEYKCHNGQAVAIV
jgi:hypothetical protein